MTCHLNAGNISLMKRLPFLFLVLILLPSFLMAKTAEDDRRIEEEKRENLRPTETEIFQEEQPSPEPTESIEIDYFKELLSKRVALNSDACKVLVILMGVEEYTKELDSQITFLRERGIIPERIATGFDSSQPLRKGLAAYMFCQALDIRGGIWMRLFGVNQRYAFRELVFEGIMSPGDVNDIMSGDELILTLTEAVEYMTANTTDKHSKGNP